MLKTYVLRDRRKCRSGRLALGAAGEVSFFFFLHLPGGNESPKTSDRGGVALCVLVHFAREAETKRFLPPPGHSQEEYLLLFTTATTCARHDPRKAAGVGVLSPEVLTPGLIPPSPCACRRFFGHFVRLKPSFSLPFSLSLSPVLSFCVSLCLDISLSLSPSLSLSLFLAVPSCRCLTRTNYVRNVRRSQLRQGLSRDVKPPDNAVLTPSMSFEHRMRTPLMAAAATGNLALFTTVLHAVNGIIGGTRMVSEKRDVACECGFHGEEKRGCWWVGGRA